MLAEGSNHTCVKGVRGWTVRREERMPGMSSKMKGVKNPSVGISKVSK